MFLSLPSTIWFLPSSCRTPLSGLRTKAGVPALSSVFPFPLLRAHPDGLPGKKGAASPLIFIGAPAVQIIMLVVITELTA